MSAQTETCSGSSGGAISIVPNTPFPLRENHQLFDGNHSWKMSTLFQDLQPTPSLLLRPQGRLGGDGLHLAALRLDHGTF